MRRSPRLTVGGSQAAAETPRHIPLPLRPFSNGTRTKSDGEPLAVMMGGVDGTRTTTVVTAVTDLHSGVDGVSRRGLGEYLHLVDRVLALDVPIVVFADRDLVPGLTERRAALAPRQPTAVLPMPPADPVDIAFLRNALSTRRPACAANPVKDTAEYLAFGWSKPRLIARAAEELPADGYWWIDAGITHVAPLPVQAGHVLANTPWSLHPGVHLFGGGDIDHLHDATANSADWWWHGAQHVAAGLIGVRHDHVEPFVQWFGDAIDDCRLLGVAATDEMLLTRAMAQHREHVRRVPAQFHSLFTQLVAATPLPLAARCPGASVVSLPGASRADRAAMNPSIAADPSGGFRVVVRHVNYRYTDAGHYEPLDGSSTIVTENVMIVLDDDLTVVSERAIDDSVARAEPPRYPVHGLEDMRLFVRDGRWFGSATVREHRNDGLCELALVEFDDSATTVVAAEVLRSPVAGRHEKNWMPIAGDGPHRFLWSADPPIVATVDVVLGTVTTEVSVPESDRPEGARGGSQVVPVGDQYVGVVHHVHWLGDRGAPRREYRHRLLVMDRDMHLVAASPDFVFEISGLEFCAGLAVNGRGLVMSYGVGDRTARLVEVPWVDLRSVVPVLRSPDG